jgi:predicted metal-binding membrane protein
MPSTSTGETISFTALLRERTLVAAALALATALAWVALARAPMAMGLLPYLAVWSLMMAAMMLPSIAPLVLLHEKQRVLLAAAYLTVWGATGVLPFAAMHWGFMPAAPLVLALAGLYELTPLKHACLTRCRNPATFLIQHYGKGALRLGLEHALWCIACCVGLMAVLVLAAAMSLWWAAVLASVVFVQKVLPRPEWSARLTGVALLAAAIVTAL